MPEDKNHKRPHLFIKEKLPDPTPRVYETGGGGGTYPRTDYQKHAKKIYKEAAQLKAIFASLEDNTPSDKVYYRVELPPKESMWSGTGTEIEENIHAQIVGSPAKNVGHFSSTKKSFNILVEQLDRYQSTEKSVGKSNFATIEKVSSIPVSEKLSIRYRRSTESKEFKNEALITLFPNLTRKEQEAYKALIAEFLKQKNGKLLGQTASEGGILFKVRAKPEVIEELAEKVLAVQAIDSVDHLLTASSQRGAEIEDEVIIHPVRSNAIACLFDSGVVQGSRLISPGLLRAQEEPFGPPLNVEHGTFVASRIMYGDSLRDQIAAGELNPDVKVLSVCVFPQDGIGNPKPMTTEHLIEAVRTTVEKHHQQIRVYNLSVNLVSRDPKVDSSIGDDIVTPMAAELDYLARKYDVLFVVSAGNYPSTTAASPSNPYPKHFDEKDARICSPAEAHLAITVGSVAERESASSMCKRGRPSPFTRRGPGFGGYRKPDLAAHGGNYGKKWFSTIDDLAVAGICKDGTHLAYGNGTSHAAPLVTRLAAHLFATIPGATAPLVRAMLIHFAALPKGTEFSEERLVDLMGNGLPAADGLLNSNRWEQSFLYQGEVEYRQIHTIPFHIPKGLVNRKGNGVVGVRVTLAINADTDRTRKGSYCKTHLRTNLQKINAKGELTGVPLGDSATDINTMYSTIIRRENTFRAGVQSGDWGVTLEQITRWNLKDVKTPFGMVLTLFDPKRDPKVDIYSMLQNEVPNRYQTELKVRSQLRL